MRINGKLGLTLVLLGSTTAAVAARPALAQEQSQAPAITLKVGDEAPKIWVTGWWKDNAPEARKKGRVYVVDFWASWCGPCRESMPHLIDMQDKYGDYADFIGISIDEDKGAAAQFLDGLGDNLKIYFAMDKNRQTWTDWAKAAGRDTIPTTFILDENGKIAFIGHPMEAEQTLRKLLIK